MKEKRAPTKKADSFSCIKSSYIKEMQCACNIIIRPGNLISCFLEKWLMVVPSAG